MCSAKVKRAEHVRATQGTQKLLLERKKANASANARPLPREKKQTVGIDTSTMSASEKIRIKEVNKLFTGYCEFVASATGIDHLPNHTGAVEIAVLGRSNVGKSSLLNALMQREKIVKTAKAPGHTKKLNFFRMGPNKEQAEKIRLVDMPGHGHAAKVEWMDLIGQYLRTGRCALVLVLVSAEHGLKQTDKLALQLLAKIRISPDIHAHGYTRKHTYADMTDDVRLQTMIVLTKQDKTSVAVRESTAQQVTEYMHELNLDTAPASVIANIPIADVLAPFNPSAPSHFVCDILSVSAREKTGVEELRLAIAKKVQVM
eukprot:CFRG6848T1